MAEQPTIKDVMNELKRLSTEIKTIREIVQTTEGSVKIGLENLKTFVLGVDNKVSNHGELMNALISYFQNKP